MNQYYIHVSRRQPSANNTNWRNLWANKRWIAWEDAREWLNSNYGATVETHLKGDGFHICFQSLEAKAEFLLREF